MSTLNSNLPFLGKRVATYYPQSNRARQLMALNCGVCILAVWALWHAASVAPNRVLVVAAALILAAGIYGIGRTWRRQSRRVYLHQQGFEFSQAGSVQTFAWDEISDVWQIPVYANARKREAPQAWTVRVQTLDGRKLKLDGFEGAKAIAHRTQEALAIRLLGNYRQAFESGSWLRFGKKLAISDEGLNVGLKALSWYEISDIFLDEQDGVRIGLCRETTRWIHLPISAISNFQLLAELLSWVKSKQSLTVDDAELAASEQRSVGLFESPTECDVSELVASGYEWDEIDDVMNGECSVDELLERGPRKRPRVPK